LPHINPHREGELVSPCLFEGSLDYAAALAQASVLFAPYEEDYPGFSEVALQAAERAYAWAEAHPQALYHRTFYTNYKSYHQRTI
jgi:hypothetical protein